MSLLECQMFRMFIQSVPESNIEVIVKKVKKRDKKVNTPSIILFL